MLTQLYNKAILWEANFNVGSYILTNHMQHIVPNHVCSNCVFTIGCSLQSLLSMTTSQESVYAIQTISERSKAADEHEGKNRWSNSRVWFMSNYCTGHATISYFDAGGLPNPLVSKSYVTLPNGKSNTTSPLRRLPWKIWHPRLLYGSCLAEWKN